MTRQNESLLNNANNQQQQHQTNNKNNTNNNNTAASQPPNLLTNGVVVSNNSQLPTNGKFTSVDMPAHCFDVVIAHLNKNTLPKCPPSIPNENFPLFVTWKKGHHRQLRGCIGTFARNLSLHDGLGEYAQISAFRDSRFDPIGLHEMPHLHCAVSLLVCFEPARHYRDWLIGVHGIRIEYRQHHRSLSAVYLPEVAHEQGWDHIETMNNLMRKGGFKGEITEVDRQAVMVERFQSEKMSISYEEYLAFKKFQQKQQRMSDDDDLLNGGGGGGADPGGRNNSNNNGFLCNGFLNYCLP